jgi:hypothetical protein
VERVRPVLSKNFSKKFSDLEKARPKLHSMKCSRAWGRGWGYYAPGPAPHLHRAAPDRAARTTVGKNPRKAEKSFLKLPGAIGALPPPGAHSEHRVLAKMSRVRGTAQTCGPRPCLDSSLFVQAQTHRELEELAREAPCPPRGKAGTLQPSPDGT